MRYRLLSIAWAVPLTLWAAALPWAEPPADGESDGKGDSPTKAKTDAKTAGKPLTEVPPVKGKQKVDMSDIPPDEKAENADLEKLGKPFKVYRTRHFSILHNVSDDDVKSFSLAIEKTYRSNVNYALSVDIEPKTPAKKLIIYYFAEHPEYSDYSKTLGKGERPQSNPGVFFPDMNRSMFYNFRNQETFKKAREEAERKIKDLQGQLKGKVSADQRRDINKKITEAKAQANFSSTQGGDQNEQTVQHEVTHHVLWNLGFHNEKTFFGNPRWFVEGTAMMFETVSTGKGSNIGLVNKERLKNYQDLDRVKQLFEVKEFICRADYFNMGPETAGRAYAQAWALVHYLNRTKRSQIKTYVELINKRKASYQPSPEREIKDFEKAFGTLDYKWTKQWQAWMKNVR